LLDIMPKPPEVNVPGTTKPVIVASVDPNNFIEVTFVKSKTGGVYIENAIDKGEFVGAGRFNRSPADLEVPQNTDKLPRSVQIRARFLDGNNPVGDWSDVVTVQTIP
jgi:hypothetical protein